MAWVNDDRSRLTALGMGVLCLSGWLARLHFVADGRFFWDEIYQYVEPAVWHITGMGVRTWEYDEAMRNWLLPAYYGALLRIARGLGWGTLQTYHALQIQSTLVSLLLIPAAYRLGWAVGEGRRSVAWLTAVLTTFLAPVVFYSSTLLSELPTLVLLTWAWALWYPMAAQPEAFPGLPRRAMLIGALAGLAVVLRYSLVVAVVPVVAEMVLRRRWATFGWMLTGALGPLVLLAVADTIAWGMPFLSAVRYVQHNLLQGQAAAQFGSQDVGYYWDTMFRCHFRIGRVLLLPLACLFFRHQARALVGFGVPLGLLSVIAHKEERFAAFCWPLLLAACSYGLVLGLQWCARHTGALGQRLHRWEAGIMAIVVLITLISSARHLRFEKIEADSFRAAAWAGSQADCTGFMSDAIDAGGYFIFGRSVPRLHWDPTALTRLDVNYLAVQDETHRRDVSAMGRYRRVGQEGRFTLYRRIYGS